MIGITSAGLIAAQGPHVVLADRAWRDKDTGYSYLPTRFLRRDPSVVNAVMLALRDHGLRGPSFNTDTDVPFPLTASAIEHCCASGAVTVRTEAAPLYAFTQARRRHGLANITNPRWSAPVTLNKTSPTVSMLR
jgi:hypothetical protein